MDFARKQLEKYGWTDGKGLGKNENGISEALKPKIKRSVTGIGHDPAAEFNEHWWTALYDKAAGNVEVEEKNGKTKKIKTKDDKGVVITTSTWKLKQKPKEVENEEQYSDFFVRTAVLTGAGNKVEKVRESESEEEESEGKKDVFKMTDEELFAACEGRTAHKGARHGLKATGKLARIAQQEAMLLHESRFSGYSHAKKLKNEAIEDMNLNSDSDSKEHKKKKKKRKRCNSNDKSIDSIQIDTKVAGTENSLPHNEMTLDENVASVINEEKNCRKSKKSKRKEVVNMEIIEEESCSSSVPAKKKKQKDKDVEVEEMDVNSSDVEIKNSRKKKKKTKTDDL